MHELEKLCFNNQYEILEKSMRQEKMDNSLDQDQ